MSTARQLPDGNWAALVPAEGVALVVCHNGSCRAVWMPLTMLDDAPVLKSYLPHAAERLWGELQGDGDGER